jgi:hypothetical protein
MLGATRTMPEKYQKTAEFAQPKGLTNGQTERKNARGLIAL